MRRIWAKYRGLRGVWQVAIAAVVGLAIIGAMTPKESTNDVKLHVASATDDQLPSATTTTRVPEVTSTTVESTTTTLAPTATTAPSTTTTAPPTTTTTEDPPPPPPTTAAPAPQSLAASNGCDSNYAGGCVPIASDVDCAGGSGNGPGYIAGPVQVVGSDIYDLDRDGDGVGCES